MKTKFFIVLFCFGVALMGYAQPNQPKDSTNIPAQRVYRVFASSETDSVTLQKRNLALVQNGASERGLLAGLGAAILAGYTNKLIQETVNATSAVIGLAVKALKILIYKNRNDRAAWLKTAEAHNHFKQVLSTEIRIDDFYYAPSMSGAMDPLNMKFNGFGCMCFFSPEKEGDSGNSHTGRHKNSNNSSSDIYTFDETGVWEFYLTCKLRDDSIGRNHMVNHSKFYMDIDQLIFDTRHISLPNDSVQGKIQKPFDFNKRKNLTFGVNVKVFSSWINEAIILTENQQIGEFDIKARIDLEDLNEQGVFVYDPVKHYNKVSLTGESFLVPRSYTGTADAPSWGTGQYRLEMTVYEDCAINKDWYQITEKTGKSRGRHPNKERWDDSKWKPEWKEMQEQKHYQTAWSAAWQSVVTAYVGRDWVQELVSPFTSAVCAQEQLVLSELLHVSSPAGGSTQSTGLSQGSSSAQTPDTPKK